MFDNRLKRLRESRNLTQKEAAIELDIAQRTYSSYENNEREPNSKILKKLSLFFGVTVDYLLGIEKTNKDVFSGTEHQHIKKYRELDPHGKDMVDIVLDKEYERSKSAEAEREAKESKPPKITIKYSLVPVSAGSGSYLDDENIEERDFPDTVEARQADIVIPVDGDSMEPMFSDGDKLYVRLQPAVEIGEIGIFERGINAFVKELGEDRLKSLNPDYDDIYPNENENIVCVGKVLGKVKK